jgi:hypothetical protein
MLPLFRKPHFYMGYSPLIEEDWDDLFAPPLTLSTRYVQYEGEGRNKFGPEINTRREPVRAVSFKPLVAVQAPVVVVPAPVILIPKPLPKPPKVQGPPLHAFCFGCGWRQGGPDSYNGLSCKCGSISAPLIGRGGLPFFT